MASWCASPSRPARTKSRTRKDCWQLSVSSRLPLPRLPVPRRPRDTLLGVEDATLRPARLADYVGQKRLKEKFGVYLEAARSRSEALDHVRSEEHTSELQSRGHLVCRLLLEKKKIEER